MVPPSPVKSPFVRNRTLSPTCKGVPVRSVGPGGLGSGAVVGPGDPVASISLEIVWSASIIRFVSTARFASFWVSSWISFLGIECRLDNFLLN